MVVPLSLVHLPSSRSSTSHPYPCRTFVAKQKRIGYYILISCHVHEGIDVPWPQGNSAFKASDFYGAVGHYSAAIVADPTNPTYPLNRAAAYLKLGKCVPPLPFYVALPTPYRLLRKTEIKMRNAIATGC